MGECLLTSLFLHVLIPMNQNLSQRVNVNGIIYMHRISDPRVSGTSRKNIKMFHSLCGEASLGNVRIVTTNWGRVTEQEGNDREADLKSGAFKALIGAGAQMHRHANTVESAREIISELILLEPVAMKIQEELRAGKKLADTAAGMVLAAEMMEARKKNELELADLTRELNSAEENNNLVLRAELEQERRVLEEQIARANADRKRLEATLDAVGVSSAGRHRRSESFPQLGEKRKEALEVPGSLQSPSGDLMSSERQPSVRSSGRSESKRRATEYPSRELDMTRGDEKTSFQLLQEELDKMRQMRLQQLELDTERMRASQEEEFRLRQQEIHLQDLRAQIRAAERKEDERSQASMSRKVVNGIAYVAHKLSGW